MVLSQWQRIVILILLRYVDRIFGKQATVRKIFHKFEVCSTEKDLPCCVSMYDWEVFGTTKTFCKITVTGVCIFLRTWWGDLMRIMGFLTAESYLTFFQAKFLWNTLVSSWRRFPIFRRNAGLDDVVHLNVQDDL